MRHCLKLNEYTLHDDELVGGVLEFALVDRVALVTISAPFI